MAEAIQVSGAGPVSLAAPTTHCASLAFSERLVLWVLRRAVMGIRSRSDEGPVMVAALSKLGAAEAVAAIEGFAMCLCWRAEGPSAIGSPADQTVSEQERKILLAFACRQVGACRCAIVLLADVTPEDHIQKALEYLDAWAEHFGKSGLYLPPRALTKPDVTVIH